jgi:hypothetical protein
MKKVFLHNHHILLFWDLKIRGWEHFLLDRFLITVTRKNPHHDPLRFISYFAGKEAEPVTQ